MHLMREECTTVENISLTLFTGGRLVIYTITRKFRKYCRI